MRARTRSPSHLPGKAAIGTKALGLLFLRRKVARQKQEAEKRGEQIALLSQIVARWARLQKTVMNPDPTALHAVDDQMRQTLTALLGNVEARAMSSQGDALIIKTGSSAVRVLYPVVMRIAPSVSFPNLPSGVNANLIENSAVGFSVIFIPPTVPIERLPTVVASAELKGTSNNDDF